MYQVKTACFKTPCASIIKTIQKKKTDADMNYLLLFFPV